MSITEYKTGRPDRSDDQVIEISLNDIGDFLRKSRLTILIATIVGVLVGWIYAAGRSDYYRSQVTVMPESHAKGAGGLGGLGSLAGLAGVNLGAIGDQSELISPAIYPNILQSKPFALSLLKDTVYAQTLNTKMTLEDFIVNTAEEDYLDQFLGLFTGSNQPAPTPQSKQQSASAPQSKPQATSDSRPDQVLRITNGQSWLVWMLQQAIKTGYDTKTGLFTITITEPDPFVAATVARLSLDYLTNYITSYRTEKTRRQVEFLEKQVNESQSRYKAAEYAVSAYRDQNRNLFLNTAKISEQRLQADYLLAQTVYNDLAKQLEQAKIKIQEETPVFKVLEPPIVPLQPNGPKRVPIVIGFGLVAAILSMITLLLIRVRRRLSVV